MNNEIGRKITSLTLMMIMVAGGLTFAVPGAMPAAHAANANLFVSAENSQFDNYMSGPQVIEVVIIDSDINDTDEAKGEPDVTVNGKKLRMVQAVDGNWYGYFADRKMAQIADSTANIAGQGLDFGVFCSNAVTFRSTNGNGGPATFTETVGVAIDEPLGSAVNGTASANSITASCGTNLNGTSTDRMNVIRENKAINNPSGSTIGTGQIGTAVNLWPFIQLYNLNPTGNVVVQYNKGGGAQTTTLTFDTVDQFAGVELDRTKYPRNAQVHATITDLWLNIDPTDEDSWTWGANSTNSTTFYQVFDENGDTAGDGSGMISIQNQTQNMMCEDNCVLLFNPNAQGTTAVVTIQDNEDSDVTISTADNPSTASTAKGTLGKNSLPITIVEQGPNSGIFGTYDEGDTSVLKVVSDAARGKSATIDYNETPTTVLIGFEFATIDIQPVDEEWSSGEEIPLVLVDGDANKNSRSDEDLDLFNPDNDLIPALRTEDPFTLGETKDSLNGFITNATFIPDGQVGTGVFPLDGLGTGGGNVTSDFTVQKFSKRAIITHNATISDAETLIVDLGTTAEELRKTINAKTSSNNNFKGFNLFNQDLRSFTTSAKVDVYLLNATSDIVTKSGNDAVLNQNVKAFSLFNGTDVQSLNIFNTNATANNSLETRLFDTTQFPPANKIGLMFVFKADVDLDDNGDGTANKDAIVADFFSFGFKENGDDDTERIAHQIIRIEAEETGDNTSTFKGSLEYTMLNQLNILDSATYTGLSTIADDPSFIVHEDLDDEESPRVNYLDLGADGVSTQVSDQEEAPAHSGVVSFDANNYKIADTVTITVEDADLNVDSDLIDIFTVVTDTTDEAYDNIGKADLPTGFDFGPLGRMLDITFDDVKWSTPIDNTSGCKNQLGNVTSDTGLGATGFSLVETGIASGVFVGDFQIPPQWCRATDTTLTDNDGFEWASNPETTTGLDIEVNYVDYRDASGEIIEVGDSAGVRANTGSVSLDRTVYPVPFGTPSDFSVATTQRAPDGESIFAIHATGVGTSSLSTSGKFLPNGDLTVHIRVNDPDFDISASGEDEIAQSIADPAPNDGVTIDNTGPVKVSIIRGAQSVILGYAGGPSATTGLIDAGTKKTDTDNVRQFGPMVEIAPDAGIFEAEIQIRYTDGPANSQCPDTTSYLAPNGTRANNQLNRFDVTNTNDYCILQGDILQVEYTDPEDASGDINTVTDSATFDLRNGVLQSDKSVYIIGSDMILTLIEPDFDLDNDQAETYDLDLIEWDSDAATVTMGDQGGFSSAFDPEPSNFRETGDSTGIFQIVIEIPEELNNDKLERGEEIVLEYTDWGPSGSDFVGEEDEDVNLTIYTSNFGATVELDQKVYTWTDKVYITIVAPDHNFDSDLVDDIGNTDLDPIKISTRGQSLDRYKLVETGTDTGIFTGEVILTGFSNHDADGDGDTNDATGITGDGSGKKNGIGPTNGLLATDDDDGITVSFEFSEDETVVGSALIRWNIGEVQWLEASYPASGTGVIRVIDPDMNLNPESVDNFNVDVWSDSDAGGIDLTVTETNEATGIFEGTVFFTTTDESSGHRLRVAEGDTVTAEYEDNTLPDPYTTADELDITATSLIGTVVPPLERAPAANLRTVDAFGNSLDTVSVDQQVQITADLANGQDREQAFAYLVQIQDASGVTVSLAWITGSLSPGQSFSPALSWIPQEAGSYTATAFVWESVDNPTALSPPVTTTINVQ